MTVAEMERWQRRNATADAIISGFLANPTVVYDHIKIGVLIDATVVLTDALRKKLDETL